MIDISLIGIGTGNPDHLTAQAARAMNEADLILLPRKGSAKADLLDLRHGICAAVLTRPVRIVAFDLPVRDAGGAYIDAVHAWHEAIARAWGEQIAMHLPDGGKLALLVWGDPSLYDSSLRIAERLQRAGTSVRVRVVPGITSIQALTAAHAIPLNRLGAAVTILTGRALRTRGWPADADTVVVMLDEGCAFQAIDPQDVHIWWGAYLGMAQEALVAGPLQSVAAHIAAQRAALRRDHGWIMDIYILRKGTGDRP